MIESQLQLPVYANSKQHSKNMPKCTKFFDCYWY